MQKKKNERNWLQITSFFCDKIRDLSINKEFIIEYTKWEINLE